MIASEKSSPGTSDRLAKMKCLRGNKTQNLDLRPESTEHGGNLVYTIYTQDLSDSREPGVLTAIERNVPLLNSITLIKSIHSAA